MGLVLTKKKSAVQVQWKGVSGGDNMFNKKKALPKLSYDSSRQRPVIKSSICTGERVAGFVDKESGKFEDIMLIRNEEDMQRFCGLYGLKAEDVGKIW